MAFCRLLLQYFNILCQKLPLYPEVLLNTYKDILKIKLTVHGLELHSVRGIKSFVIRKRLKLFSIVY